MIFAFATTFLPTAIDVVFPASASLAAPVTRTALPCGTTSISAIELLVPARAGDGFGVGCGVGFPPDPPPVGPVPVGVSVPRTTVIA